MKTKKLSDGNNKSFETREKKKDRDQKNWLEDHLAKNCNIVVDAKDVQVLSVDGALFKMNQQTQAAKLLFYYIQPFESNGKNRNRLQLRATVELRMNLKTMISIADSINRYYSTMQNQTSFPKCTDSEQHIMFS